MTPASNSTLCTKPSTLRMCFGTSLSHRISNLVAMDDLCRCGSRGPESTIFAQRHFCLRGEPYRGADCKDQACPSVIKLAISSLSAAYESQSHLIVEGETSPPQAARRSRARSCRRPSPEILRPWPSVLSLRRRLEIIVAYASKPAHLLCRLRLAARYKRPLDGGPGSALIRGAGMQGQTPDKTHRRGLADSARFLKSLLAAPRLTGAVAPSGRALARAMAAAVGSPRRASSSSLGPAPARSPGR